MTIESNLEIESAGGCLGAVITGLDLSSPPGPKLRDRIGELVREYKAVVFRDLFATAGQQSGFARRFGKVYKTPYDPLADPDIPDVTIHRSQDGYIANVWHSDGQNRLEPNEFVTLSMVQCPRRGGDTVWSNQEAVYEALSPPLQAMLDGLTAIQRSAVDPSSESEHPAVITHPRTGKRLLYISKHHTVRFVELTMDESRALIDHLTAFSIQPEFTYRHSWQKGEMAMWDNLATQHYAVGDYYEPRIVQRAMVLGQELPGRVEQWPVATDLAKRTLVIKGGSTATVGEMSRENRADG